MSLDAHLPSVPYAQLDDLFRLGEDLSDRRLLPFSRRLPGVLNQDMIDLHTLGGPRLSPLGEELLDFIRDPLAPSRLC